MLELRDYQEQRLNYHLTCDRSLELLPMGRGKTPMMCIYSKFQLECFNQKSVWVMPGALFAKNKEEIMKWCNLEDEQVAVCVGTKQKREKIYADKNVKVFMLTGDTFGREWEMLPKDVEVLVIDEFHKNFASHKSKRTQSFYRSSRSKFKKIKMMTGTIVAGRYSSAYPAIAVIEPRYYLNYENFLRTHAIYNKFNAIVGWGRPEKLRTILEKHSSGMSDPFEGRPDLKEIIFEKCNFDESQKSAYKEMEEEALLELEDRFLDARDSGGVKSIRCRQILFSPASIGLDVKSLGVDESLKIHIENAIEEKERILVFATFVDEQNRIKKMCQDMGVRAEVMNGMCNDIKKGEIDAKFRNGEIDVLIASPEVASLGFNWEFVKEIVFTSLTYDNATLDQAMARGDRGSRTRSLLVYFLTYDTKIEKRILQILQRKNKELNLVMN